MSSNKTQAVILAEIHGSSKLHGDISHDVLLRLGRGGEYIDRLGWGKSQKIDSEAMEILVFDPRRALEVAFLFKSIANSYRQTLVKVSSKPQIDMRLAIGIGGVSEERGAVNSESKGTAFQRAQRGWDILKAKKKRSVVIMSGNRSADLELHVEVSMLEAIISRWSSASAEVLYSYLMGSQTQIEIANKLDISQSSVQRRMDAMDWNALVVFIKRFQTLVNDLQ